MAQIRIEEKKTSILPWILGLIFLAFAVWAVFALLNDGDNDQTLLDKEETEAPVAEMATGFPDQTDDTYTDVDATSYRPAISEFISYTDNMQGEMGLDHEFSHQAISYLANATEALADAHDINLTDNVKRAKELADEITVEPYATNHADKIRMAALNITETLEKVDMRIYKNAGAADLKNLRKEAQAINAETLTLNQKENVRGFLSAARNVLSRMQ